SLVNPHNTKRLIFETRLAKFILDHSPIKTIMKVNHFILEYCSRHSTAEDLCFLQDTTKLFSDPTRLRSWFHFHKQFFEQNSQIQLSITDPPIPQSLLSLSNSSIYDSLKYSKHPSLTGNINQTKFFNYLRYSTLNIFSYLQVPFFVLHSYS